MGFNESRSACARARRCECTLRTCSTNCRCYCAVHSHIGKHYIAKEIGSIPAHTHTHTHASREAKREMCVRSVLAHSLGPISKKFSSTLKTSLAPLAFFPRNGNMRYICVHNAIIKTCHRRAILCCPNTVNTFPSGVLAALLPWTLCARFLKRRT